MSTTDKIVLDRIYKPSDDVVFREIEGEPIIVPLTGGIGDVADALFSLNETGRAIWDRLDGKTTLRAVTASVAEEFETSTEAIEADVVGFAAELLTRGIIAVVPDGAA